MMILSKKTKQLIRLRTQKNNLQTCYMIYWPPARIPAAFHVYGAQAAGLRRKNQYDTIQDEVAILKKGDIYEGTVSRVDFPNKGRVELPDEDTVVTVKNTIPGQKIRFAISSRRNGNVKGRCLEVLEHSPMETREPVCGEFPDCGGCLYQTMDYEEQLAMKADQVKRLLDTAMRTYGQTRDGEPDYVFEGITPSPTPWHYRNKMEYSFGDAVQGGPLTLGLHRKGSKYDVLSCCDCQLVHDDFNVIVQATQDYFRGTGLPFYRKMQHTGYLRHLLLRRSVTTGDVLVHIVTTSQQEFDMQPYAQMLLALPLEGQIAGIMHIINDSAADIVQSDETKILYGRDYFYEKVLGLDFKVSTFSFFQTNTKGAERLYEIARSYIGDTNDMTVFDLYSGTGTIAQLLAPVSKKVIGVEIVGEAVEAARYNAEMNGIKNCSFIAGDVLKVLDEIEEKPDFIVLDPPRDGIHPKALPKILHYGVPNIVYISCKPTSLARDLETFAGSGYRLVRARCCDMFPFTQHVETVCLMSRVEGK